MRRQTSVSAPGWCGHTRETYPIRARQSCCSVVGTEDSWAGLILETEVNKFGEWCGEAWHTCHIAASPWNPGITHSVEWNGNGMKGSVTKTTPGDGVRGGENRMWKRKRKEREKSEEMSRLQEQRAGKRKKSVRGQLPLLVGIWPIAHVYKRFLSSIFTVIVAWICFWIAKKHLKTFKHLNIPRQTYHEIIKWYLLFIYFVHFQKISGEELLDP